MTKCWGLVGDTPGLIKYGKPELQDTRDYVNQSGLSRGAIYNAVEKSLEVRFSTLDSARTKSNGTAG